VRLSPLPPLLPLLPGTPSTHGPGSCPHRRPPLARSSTTRNACMHRARARPRAAEAQRRLELYGPNSLTPPKKTTFLERLWGQLNNAVVAVLLAAAIVVRCAARAASLRLRRRPAAPAALLVGAPLSFSLGPHSSGQRPLQPLSGSSAYSSSPTQVSPEPSPKSKGRPPPMPPPARRVCFTGSCCLSARLHTPSPCPCLRPCRHPTVASSSPQEGAMQSWAEFTLVILVIILNCAIGLVRASARPTPCERAGVLDCWSRRGAGDA
jgi:hypothetical protein